MDVNRYIEREMAMRMAEQRPEGFAMDASGDFFWENQILLDLLEENKNQPEMEIALTYRLQELAKKGTSVMPYEKPYAYPNEDIYRQGRLKGFAEEKGYAKPSPKLTPGGSEGLEMRR